MLKSITLEVVGDQKIVCEGCEERIETVVKSVRGVNKVRAHARHQRIEILFDTAVLAPAAVVEKLSKAGYDAKIAPGA